MPIRASTQPLLIWDMSYLTLEACGQMVCRPQVGHLTHLFLRCKQTSEMVAIQVSIGIKLFMGTWHVFQVICMLTT